MNGDEKEMLERRIVDQIAETVRCNRQRNILQRELDAAKSENKSLRESHEELCELGESLLKGLDLGMPTTNKQARFATAIAKARGTKKDL